VNLKEPAVELILAQARCQAQAHHVPGDFDYRTRTYRALVPCSEDDRAHQQFDHIDAPSRRAL
jgi:hypothetical protein